MGNANSSSVQLSLLSVSFPESGSVTVYAQAELTLRETAKFKKRITVDSSDSLQARPDSEGGVVALRVWPGAITFSDYLLGAWDIFIDKTVVELGCGVGLPSLVLAKYCKTLQVILTDRESVAHVASANISANDLKCSAEFETLDWGDKYQLDAFRIRHPRIDFIIGTEIVYAEEQEPLLNALSAVCESNPDGSKPILILSYTNRSEGDEQYLSSVLERFTVRAQIGSVFHLIYRDYMLF